jgi:hypothetical protein
MGAALWHSQQRTKRKVCVWVAHRVEISIRLLVCGQGSASTEPDELRADPVPGLRAGPELQQLAQT